MPLLYLAQRDKMYVTKSDMEEIGEIIGISSTEVDGIVGFYTLYYDAQGGKYRIQVCTDLPCALRGAEEFLDRLCENVGIRVGESTPDGMVTIENVTCLAACDRAPMFQVQSGDGLAYHENQTAETALEIINHLRAGERKNGHE
jgi:NADH:ubiquinone oxidoreductase subunit E